MENGIKWLNDHDEKIRTAVALAVIFLLGYRRGYRKGMTRGMKIDVHMHKCK